MSDAYCLRCGSLNHSEFDCTKPPGTTFTPPPASPAAAAAPAPASVLPTPDPPLAAPGPVFEAGERYRGCPPICTSANLPHFKTEDELNRWRTMPERDGHKLQKKWACRACGGWHYLARPRGPSGSSSDTERDSQYPHPNFRPFMTEATRQRIDRTAPSLSREAELPQQAAPAKETALPRAPKEGKVKETGMLV